MAKTKTPSTQAIRFLRSQNIEFKGYFYRYMERGGTREPSKQLNIEERRIIKTLVFEDDNSRPLIVLMNGDYETSKKQLSRLAGSKSVNMPSPSKAEKYTGYRVGGTSPFGCRTKMKIFAQKDIFDFERILINGGQRGFLIEIKTDDLIHTLKPEIADIAIKLIK